MTPVSQSTQKALEQEPVYYPAPVAEAANLPINSNHSYAVRQVLLESISGSHLGLAKDLSALEMMVLSANNVTQELEAIDRQLDEIKSSLESLPSIPLEAVKFLQSLAEPLEELRARKDLIATYELAARLHDLDLSEFEDSNEWKEIFAKVGTFANELLQQRPASIFRGAPAFLISALDDTPSQSERESSRDRLDDLAVQIGAIGLFMRWQDERHPHLHLLTELSRLIDKTQYRQMEVHVTKSLCETLPELQELTAWLDEQEEAFTDVQNIKELRSAIISLSDFSLSKMRDIRYAEVVKRTEQVKVQEFLSTTSSNLAGVSLEDNVSDYITSIGNRIQVFVCAELDKVRGLSPRSL